MLGLVGYGVLNCSTLHNDNVVENIIQKFKKIYQPQIAAQSHIITATLALKSNARYQLKHGFIAF